MFGSLGLNSGKVLSDCAAMLFPFYVRMKINNVHELVDVNLNIPSLLTPCNRCELNPAMRLTHLLSPPPGEFHKPKSLDSSYKRQFYYNHYGHRKIPKNAPSQNYFYSQIIFREKFKKINPHIFL